MIARDADSLAENCIPSLGFIHSIEKSPCPQLDAFIKRQRIKWELATCGQVRSTPSFKAGVSLLAHCVGPSMSLPNRDELLYQTYCNALLAIDDNIVVNCAAIVSISTGRLRFPVKNAAKIALRVARDVMLEWDFRAKLVFVCFEKSVLKAFQRAQRKLLQAVDEASFVVNSTRVRK